MSEFDVIIIGGGHAGCEAATAAARRGARTALLTMSRHAIGAMSCNPAIGGIGKGHLVREVDVFDGLIARAADGAAIHYRMLNSSKGSAVRGPRVQADRSLFRRAVQRLLAFTANLTIVEGKARALKLTGGTVSGVELSDDTSLTAPTIILATGTFLGGRLFRGDDRLSGGRINEGASVDLARQLRELGLPMARMKTGTPPRLDGRTIDWSRLALQPSDVGRWTMSPVSRRRDAPQLFCAATRTNGRTHDIIRDGFSRSPLFAGAIEGQGPRYCPSIEDKVRRFGDRDGHHIFLEPEGVGSNLIYPNGISTSLPTDLQQKMVASIAGLEDAQIVEPGYAVEYDHVDPRALTSSLGLRALPGLYMAGQINGTTGYEEAAAQGLVAGLNAAAQALGIQPAEFDRSDSYIGVMVDDLTLQGVTEPYRMLTARAEQRLHLRADNAEQRLGAVARELGCLSDERTTALSERERARALCRNILSQGAGGSPDDPGAEALASLRTNGIPDDILSEVIDDARYEPYIQRQRTALAAARRCDRAIPCDFDFSSVRGLSLEMMERLEAARPTSLLNASRIAGITPAAISALIVTLSRRCAA